MQKDRQAVRRRSDVELEPVAASDPESGLHGRERVLRGGPPIATVRQPERARGPIADRPIHVTRIAYRDASPFLRNAPSELLIEAGDDRSPRTSATREILAFESPFKRELVAFHDAATGGPEPPTSGADGLRDVALCQSIVRASRIGGPVTRPSEIAGASVAR